MGRLKQETSRREIIAQGWKISRVYLRPENKKKLMKYKINEALPNLDFALDEIISKCINTDGGLVK